jgi:hypothetical protein
MQATKLYYLLGALLIIGMVACNHDTKKQDSTTTPATAPAAATSATYKGLYSFAPGAKTFQNCTKGHELWVADSSAQLELKYSQLVSFEKTGDPVYVEVEAQKIKSGKDGVAAACDSTLVVKKLIKITADIPKGCNL